MAGEPTSKEDIHQTAKRYGTIVGWWFMTSKTQGFNDMPEIERHVTRMSAIGALAILYLIWRPGVGGEYGAAFLGAILTGGSVFIIDFLAAAFQCKLKEKTISRAYAMAVVGLLLCCVFIALSTSVLAAPLWFNSIICDGLPTCEYDLGVVSATYAFIATTAIIVVLHFLKRDEEVSGRDVGQAITINFIVHCFLVIAYVAPFIMKSAI